MKYKDISRTELLKYMPATIKWVEAYDSSLTDTEIILRDTDHAYESLRFELSNHQAQNNSILGDIYHYVATHCCLCGSCDEIQIDEYDARASDAMLNTFCGRCFSIKKGVYSRIKYNLRHNITTDINPKTRIKFEDGHISYVRLYDLSMDEQSNVRMKKNGKKVYIVGVDLGGSRIIKKKIYDGDIVICTMADSSRFGGMIVDFPSINPQWHGERFMICHGYGNLASPLSAANVFEIIGNVGEFSGFNGFGPSEDFFEQWFNENQNKFNSYFLVDDKK